MTVTNEMLLVSVDPGKSSGGCALSYEEDSAPSLSLALQVGGGVSGFREMVSQLQEFEGAVWISEKFAPRPGAFGQSLDSTLPLVCEGVLIDRGLLPEYPSNEKRWVQPAQQYIAGGKGKAERKKRQHALLRDTGFYRTGKDLDAPDADDFRSACAHALSWLMRTGHKLTYDMISDWNERNA